MKHRHKAPLKHVTQRPPFQAFTIKHTNIVDRIITDVKLSQAHNPSVTPISQMNLFSTTALWDTGATKSVITQATASSIDLVPVGSTNVNHAGGSSFSNTYLVNIFLPNMVGIVGVLVSECPNITGNFGAIIGMDIISGGDLSITNANSNTWMTFRYPSYKTCDYVVDFNRLWCKGLPSYAPCPCGRKDKLGKPVCVKNCHGQNV
jgi:hypothetical protein